MQHKKLIIKRFSVISSVSMIALGILFILFGCGIIFKQDTKLCDICVGTVLIFNVIDNILSIKTVMECEKNG